MVVPLSPSDVVIRTRCYTDYNVTGKLGTSSTTNTGGRFKVWIKRYHRSGRTPRISLPFRLSVTRSNPFNCVIFRQFHIENGRTFDMCRSNWFVFKVLVRRRIILSQQGKYDWRRIYLNVLIK